MSRPGKDSYKYKKKVDTPFPDSLTHLDCPECSSLIKASNMSLDKLVAKCDHCNAVFNFEQELPPIRRKPEIFMPKEMEVLKLRSELEINFKWRKQYNSFLLIFTMFWNGAILPFAIGAILSGQLMLLVFLSVHLMVGLSLLYYTITHFTNTTYITVDENILAIEHRPLRLPFYNDVEISAKEVEQIYVEKYVSSRTNGVPNYAYSVSVILKSGRKHKLVKGLKHADQAQYIEQEIELFLRIDDAPVKGEY